MAWRYTFHLFGTVWLAVALAPQAWQSLPLETVSIASERLIFDPANIVLGSTTVSAAGPAVTIDGAIVSEDSNEDLFIDGVEVLTVPTNHVRTTSSSLSQSISQSESCYVGVCYCV